MKISMGLLVTTLASVVLSGQAMAQDGDKPPTLNPLEIYTCNYLDGKGRGDLDKVISRWNKRTDANDPARLYGVGNDSGLFRARNHL